MIDTLPKKFRDHCTNNGNLTMLLSKDENGVFQSISAGEVMETARALAYGFRDLGIKRGDHVGIIADNRKEWIMSDLALLSMGAADVPRGSDSTADEIRFILDHAECRVSLVENEQQLKKLMTIKADLPVLNTIVVMDHGFSPANDRMDGVRVLALRQLLEDGRSAYASDDSWFDKEVDDGRGEDIATLIYTSGTTGEPKGVMLTHSNYMHQVRAPHTPLEIIQGDIVLTVLPVWHSYERALEYVMILAGCALAYSKPVGAILLEDMGKVRPMIFPSVPRIWEGVRAAVYRNIRKESAVKRGLFLFFVAVGTAHSKLKTMLRGLKPQFRKRSRFLDVVVSFIPLLLLTPFNALGQILVFKKLQDRLGGRFRYGVSGGGALPPYVDNFFAAAGILLLEGYGLTETSPIVSARNSRTPVPGTIGKPMPEVEIRVVDQNGREVGPGEKGVLHVRGPNVMKGYYKRPDLTALTISEDGWLNTGDLAVLTHGGEIAIIGREKETIVLLGGENIEPGPIEETILQSDFIDQVMVVGQDKKYLGALVVPNFDMVEQFAKDSGVTYNGPKSVSENQEVLERLTSEINEKVNLKTGFKAFERVARIKILPEPFEVGVEMTHTLKLKRNVIADKYKKDIEALLA